MNETPNTHTVEFSDAMVSTYETWAEPLSARLAGVALKRTSLRAGDHVLDIGAGTGALALQAAALGARVTAVDLSSAMVARLTQRLAPYPECKALVMDGQALTFDDSTFDAAFSILSTTLFPNWGEAVVVVVESDAFDQAGDLLGDRLVRTCGIHLVGDSFSHGWFVLR